MSSPRVLPKLSILALSIATCLLPACSSGGGVAYDAPPVVPTPTTTPPPPAPPPARAMTLPAAPAPTTTPLAPAINAPATPLIRLLGLGQTETMNGVSGAGSLTKQGEGELFLYGEVRFDAGVTVEGGLVSQLHGTLFADVGVSEGAVFEMSGDIVGDIVNNGTFDPTDPPTLYDAFYDGDIFGDYTQGPNGVLKVGFGTEATNAATPLLEVAGKASLDGVVEFTYASFIPAAGYLEWVLHARGGIVGQFDGWRSSAIFLTGELNYGPNDVWFVATRASTQATLATAHVSDATVLSSAGNVDAAFVAGDRFAGGRKTNWMTRNARSCDRRRRSSAWTTSTRPRRPSTAWPATATSPRRTRWRDRRSAPRRR